MEVFFWPQNSLEYVFLFQIAWGHLTFVGIFFFFFLRKGYFHQVELKTDRNHLYLGGNPRVFYKKKKTGKARRS